MNIRDIFDRDDITDMNIIHYNHVFHTYKKIDRQPRQPITITPQDRLMIPKTANLNQIEWIKKYLLSPDTKYTLFERDPYLVFFFV